MTSIRRIAALGAAVALLVGPVASAHTPGAIHSEDKRYIAASVHEHLTPLHQAFGPVDCPENLMPITGPLGGVLGGACFNTGGFEGLEFVLTAQDNITARVSMFAGFDMNGDGCVGCVPGADIAWEGIDRIGGFVAGDVLAVFVRLASHQGGGPGFYAATTGWLHLDIFEPGSPDNPCGDRFQGQDGHSPSPSRCGQEFRSSFPYAYPCLPACSRD